MPGPDESGIAPTAEPGRRYERRLPLRRHAYEDARQKRPIEHEHGGRTVLTDGAEALRRAEGLAREFPDGWVYIHLEYGGRRSR
jgi:hypothetical protein